MIAFNKEQIYIVTGASSGIGKAVALLLNELGASVIAIARDKERLESMRAESKNPNNIYIEIKDLCDDIETLPTYIKSLKEKYGKLSGMAYCAGIGNATSIQSVEIDSIKKVFDINYYTPVFMTKGVIDKRNNIGSGTSIVVISSIASVYFDKGMSIYCGAKAALNASMKVISKEVAKNKIRVNCLSPSLINTPLLEDFTFDEEKSYLDSYPFGIGEPNDVANMTIFLLSNKAKYLSGQNYIIDSGGVV
ncbi:MAG: SDR family oxidoreductase [Helicobacteraceae bacterium]|nr:SDR family oxidoreductase [Helicobacteraceae bacterium]